MLFVFVVVFLTMQLHSVSLHMHNCVLPWFKPIPVSHTGGYENERDAPSVGPSPIINIKKEKRETEEETKEILRKLERDNVSCLIVSHLY